MAQKVIKNPIIQVNEDGRLLIEGLCDIALRYKGVQYREYINLIYATMKDLNIEEDKKPKQKS